MKIKPYLLATLLTFWLYTVPPRQKVTQTTIEQSYYLPDKRHYLISRKDNGENNKDEDEFTSMVA